MNFIRMDNYIFNVQDIVTMYYHNRSITTILRNTNIYESKATWTQEDFDSFAEILTGNVVDDTP